MSTSTVSRATIRAVSKSRPSTSSARAACRLITTHTTPRYLHYAAASSPIIPATRQHRPTLRSWSQQQHVSPGRRTIFIQTEDTPNEDALKFKPNHRVLPENIGSSLEYSSPRSTLAPPHPSPLAAQLMNIDGVTNVFFGHDFITVTKDSSVPWPHVKAEIFSLITEYITAGKSMINTVDNPTGEAGQGNSPGDSLAYNEDDDEVVQMIKELLETRIRPAIMEDGGDIEFCGFEDGYVKLRLRGACKGCDKSAITLQNGIESMMMHYISEVKGVQQVLSPEDDISQKEFQKFEEKLLKTKGPDAIASTSWDRVEP
ncbi:HIRA-interacting protein [Patellaria atrata CBS 101060]|uniref:HIRA-interacting protein n=1 Tax=Patellaria atrata CBS 101060 TaxID=1346257 RepID=A0A9P4SBB8_9PEZI|nr:HIRA-interacting protein [Patellaria atrata CBS 101060]